MRRVGYIASGQELRRGWQLPRSLRLEKPIDVPNQVLF